MSIALLSKTFKLISLTAPVTSSVILSRNYAFKSDLKIYWKRPVKVPSISPEKSGDLEKITWPKENELMESYEKSEELKTADDLVKAQFTFAFNKRGAMVRVVTNETNQLVKRHCLDTASHERLIAGMTTKIRSLQDIVEQFPRNKVVKKQLKELIEKRKKYLRLLRKWDYRKFEWILDQLNLKYKPYPEKFHPITRKDGLRKLTKLHCENLQQEKLDAYRKELETKQLSFLEDKLKNLEFIRKEQIECRVPVSITTDEIDAVRKQYKELKSRRDEEAEIIKAKNVEDDYELKL
ncbi:CLUMA_CG021342, isoform A [Clunio marinus]|uniref:Small ribosomal subunit protein uS15m n=1 Tax=Clunio marinus TaxID=568069 RepID=A0A1J1J819_9DIPT|nr:CLUMA_CG021342, isoform A [Clunio marinus]